MLYDAFGQRFVSTIYEPLNQYHVVMEVAPQFQQSPDTLESVYVHSSNGNMVPLSSFAHFGPANTSLGGQSSRSMAGGDDFVQSRSRHITRPGNDRH